MKDFGRPRSILMGILILLISLYHIACSTSSGSDALHVVKPVELKTIAPEKFTVEEWYVPYYLNHFSRVANSVIDTGATKGFIDIMVWRTPDVNKPYNARIMESVLSLVWFYTTDKPWNLYYADPALRTKIESALTFWCNMQNEDGQFSEYAPQKWSLAPTAFATKFIGRALYLLEEGPEIDKRILERTRQALRKALHISFTDAKLWEHGRNFTNQYANLWGGALMYLKHNPDQAIDQLLINRLDQSMVAFQSPCGYFYEKNGPDWGYNLSTHHSDLHVAWHYAKGTRLQDYFLTKTARWYDWFSYNAVKEPGSSRYYLNKAIETRTDRWYVDTDSLENPAASRWTPQAEFIPIARAFALSKEEYDAACKKYYQQMRDQYPGVPELKVGGFWSFSPYAFLHNELYRWLPSDKQKKEAVADLPYLKSETFTAVRKDNRNNTSHSFIRRPSYYVIFNAGQIITEQQRYGLGLVWNPLMGTLLQSQSGSDHAAWGTKVENQLVYEARSFHPTFKTDNTVWVPAAGINEREGKMEISYPLDNKGTKVLSFDPDRIVVKVGHEGTFTEVFPLLVNKETDLRIFNDGIVLKNSHGTMRIRVTSPATISRLPRTISLEGEKMIVVVEVRALNTLHYEISFQ